MFRNRKYSAACAAAVLATLASAGIASADPFTFGVIADTQDTIGTGTNTVSTNIIAAVNAQFIAKHVSFVVQPGDLGDSGSVASLTTRLAANAPLTAAGIPFYGLRGNHEDNAAGQTFFNANYIPTSTSSAVVERQAGTSNYTVTYQGTKIVMLDILTADSATAMTSATNWMNNTSGIGAPGVLQEADHTQAFVFQHKNLLGQNHKDNAFGSSNDANPTQQNTFFAALAGNNVKFDISGHDHMNHRSIVTSPDGLNKVQEIISASDSTKFYTASSGFSSRETTVSDQQNKIGYYTYTVDGPRVTGKYYATDKTTTASGADGDIKPNPVWTLQDTFGYSLNGRQVTVARGTSYVGITDNTDLAIGLATKYGETGYVGTSMSILGGSNSLTATAEGSRPEADDLNTGWAPRTNGLASDVLTLWGMNNALDGAAPGMTDDFVLCMTLSTGSLSTGQILLGKDANGNWVNAVDLNTGGTKNFVLGAYSSGFALGTYGVDPSTDTAWAVVNHTGEFGVAVPLPGAVWSGLALMGGMLVHQIRRRRHA